MLYLNSMRFFLFVFCFFFPIALIYAQDMGGHVIDWEAELIYPHTDSPGGSGSPEVYADAEGEFVIPEGYTDSLEHDLENGLVGDAGETDTGTGLLPPENDRQGNFWVSGGIETAMYSDSGFCYGGSLSIAFGKGVSIGGKAAYFINFDTGIDALEYGFLLRFYFLGISSYSGPFFQLSGGQVFLFRRSSGLLFPAEWGTIYAGAETGWRFLLGKNFFMEPFIRGGFPYLIGGGISAGFVF